jgi:hypothetical protein
MGIRLSRTHLIFGSITLGVGFILAGFQNCSSQDYTNSLVEPSGTIVDASNMDKIPFAFDFQANQLSYMSCTRSGDKNSTSGLESSTTHLGDPNVFFTFKIGAYVNSGLSFRPEFINYVKETFTYKGVLNDTEIQNAITYGTEHGGAALQFAVRDSTPISSQIQYLSSSGGPQEGISYQLFPKNVLLTKIDFLPQLVALFKNPTVRLNNLGSSALQSYRLEAAIHQESVDGYNELTAEDIRKKLETDSILSTLLAVTYSKDLRLSENATDNWVARETKSTTSDNRAWGSGFKVNFSSDVRMPWKKNVISSLVEYDLSTFEPTANNWSCPQSFRYIIISPQDRAAYPCNEVANENSLNAVQRDDLMKIRRHLAPSEWIIDPIHQCVSPKQTNLDCYGNRAFNPVIYSPGTQCGLDSNNLYLHKDCAEFVSFCFRQ